MALKVIAAFSVSLLLFAPIAGDRQLQILSSSVDDGSPLDFVCELVGGTTLQGNLYFKRPTNTDVVRCDGSFDKSGCTPLMDGYEISGSSSQSYVMTILSFNSSVDAGTWTCYDDSISNTTFIEGEKQIRMQAGTGHEGNPLDITCELLYVTSLSGDLKFRHSDLIHAQCDGYFNSSCAEHLQGYSAVAAGSGKIYIMTIRSLNSSRDAGNWTCQDNDTSVTINIAIESAAEPHFHVGVMITMMSMTYLNSLY